MSDQGNAVADAIHSAVSEFSIGQWLSGSTAKAYRPTLSDLEAAGYMVTKRDDVGSHVRLGREELAALVDVCRHGYSVKGRAADALRHIEQRLASRLRQQP